MDQDIKFFVGLDVHKESTSISVCEADREASQFRGTIGHDVPALLKVLRKLGVPATQLVAYEAGPTGYGLYRRLIPQRAGDAMVSVLSSRVLGKQPADQLVKKWRIHTPPHAVRARCTRRHVST
jgi:hypothetical protein